MAGFLALSVLLILTPGPNQALLTSRVLAGGRRAGLATVGGLMCGMAVHIVAALVGLSALLAASADVFAVVKVLGGAYLAVLGLLALRAAGRRRAAGDAPAPEPARGRAFRDGLVSMTFNPKAAVFFVAVVPQFVAPGPQAALRVAALLGLYGAMSTAFWLGLVLAVARARVAIARPAVRAWLERVTGAALVALGLRLALEPWERE